MDIAASSALLVFLTFCSGYWSASETALFSLPATKCKGLLRRFKSRRRLISQLIKSAKGFACHSFHAQYSSEHSIAKRRFAYVWKLR